MAVQVGVEAVGFASNAQTIVDAKSSSDCRAAGQSFLLGYRGITRYPWFVEIP
jgi:hypothetical protein